MLKQDFVFIMSMWKQIWVSFSSINKSLKQSAEINFVVLLSRF